MVSKEEESKKKRKAVEEYSVRRKIGAPDNVKAKDIELWRVNVPFEEFKENSILLNNIEVKEKLFPTVKISSVFDDEIPELKIHFIVKVPANIEGYILSELDLMTLSPNVKSYSTKDENVKEICKMPCPSTSASPAGQIYQNESDRQHALRPFFTSLFDGIQPISIVTDNGSIDDDVLLIDNTVFEEKAVPILWEYKNEIGTEGKDPSIQGRCGYAKYWAQSQIKSNKY
ncbi:hypothetical protein GLOIN_2v1780863 [Rhizophagus irregularis DAOM 181602=DAOM 197198]|nr:hypothetical protein GLOIN_2v1780863 [Rhizophagus irregularis DAOM 181602=DAOM 197198]